MVSFLVKIDYHPLRMQRIVLSRERLREIRIALPVCIQISVVQAREAVDSVPPLRVKPRCEGSSHKSGESFLL